MHVNVNMVPKHDEWCKSPIVVVQLGGAQVAVILCPSLIKYVARRGAVSSVSVSCGGVPASMRAVTSAFLSFLKYEMRSYIVTVMHPGTTTVGV